MKLAGPAALVRLMSILLVLSSVAPIYAQHDDHAHHSHVPAAAPSASLVDQTAAITGRSSSVDFFTNFGSYFARTHCMVRADGTPDWPWIIASIVLNVGVLTGYLLIFRFWCRSYYGEARIDRNPKLMYLALIFLMCATTGYTFQIVLVWWPAYRLQVFFLGILTMVTWLFAWNAKDLRASFSAFRLQRELEQSLRNRTAELEKLVGERTLELETARIDAIAATEAKSRFVAHMSHEIRTPLTAMLGYAALLDGQGGQQVDEKKRQEYIDTVRQSGQHLLGVINDILDLSKIEAGKMDLTCSPTDIRQLVQQCVTLFAGRAQEKSLAVNTDIEPVVPELLGLDAMRIKQIVANLLGNAVKYAQQGNIDVVVRYEFQQLTLQVRDTGPGIEEEKLRKLFEPFTQVDTSMSRPHGGTGLGLAICRRLAQLMGGSASAQSRVGRGSTFTVMIPAKPAGNASADRVSSAPKLENGVLVGRRLLVAEDHARLRQLAVLCLEKAGGEVVAVPNGEEALLVVEKQTFDLILLDMQMPIRDGYSTAGELRNRGFTGPIVAFTAHAFASERDACLEAGCSHVLTKPFEPAEISRTLAGYIEEARVQ